MASAAASEPALPPLIGDRLQIASRVVTLSTASAHALATARFVSDRFGVDLIVTAGTDGIPCDPPREDDFMVHGVPDVFGRVLDAPEGWEALVVVDRICGTVWVNSPWRMDVGDEPAHDPERLSLALAQLDRHLRQQRRVRPLFSPPPALGLPYIAPDGITLPGAFGRIEAPAVPGLPDLVVVRPDGDPATVR
ncbi:MAG: hypothetical protein WD990_11920 [Acidimicrobiia bacterium]